MDLKRRISYQWKLFIPLVVTLWLIIIGASQLQYSTEHNYRRAQIEEQLSLIVERVINIYEHESDPVSFVDFAAEYYHQNDLYGNLRITLYRDGKIQRVYGQPILLNNPDVTDYRTTDIKLEGMETDRMYSYKYLSSSDGRLAVCTILPTGDNVNDAVIPSHKFLWMMIAVAIATTIMAFFSTRYLGRNIRILRRLAERAATDKEFIPEQSYPRDELGDITRQIISLYNDRSEAMDRQQREHAVAIHAIEEKTRIKRELTSNINHELRTPISVIKGYIDTIVATPDMDKDSQRHFLEKTQMHIDRLVDMIANISTITRLDEGGEIISTEELNYHDLVFATADEISESGILGEMELSCKIPLDCKISGNYQLLSGMIVNLAKNAGAYSKGSKCELDCVGSDDKFYHFEFRDDGVGVSADQLPRLFDRFYRIDSGRTRKAGGTGLGLSIVKSTITAHGGNINVENRESGGLCFKFTLPKYI